MGKMRAAPKKGTPGSCNYDGVQLSTVRRDYVSISQMERERARRENFQRGGLWAAVLMCVMFAVLSVGCWWFGW